MKEKYVEPITVRVSEWMSCTFACETVDPDIIRRLDEGIDMCQGDMYNLQVPLMPPTEELREVLDFYAHEQVTVLEVARPFAWQGDPVVGLRLQLHSGVAAPRPLLANVAYATLRLVETISFASAAGWDLESRSLVLYFLGHRPVPEG